MIWRRGTREALVAAFVETAVQVAKRTPLETAI
jgi:hypothetical protein